MSNCSHGFPPDTHCPTCAVFGHPTPRKRQTTWSPDMDAAPQDCVIDVIHKGVRVTGVSWRSVGMQGWGREMWQGSHIVTNMLLGRPSHWMDVPDAPEGIPDSYAGEPLS